MIRSFNHDEKKALIAIMKFIARSDGRITPQEIRKFDEIAVKNNFGDFSAIFDEVDREIRTIEDLMALAGRVRNRTHEEDILRYAFEMSIAGTTINPDEVEILKMLGEKWKVNIKKLLKEQ